jgi:hypothetical protein
MKLSATIMAITITTTITMAGMPNTHTWPMEHIMVSMDNNQLHAHVNTSADNPIEMLRFAGESYDDNASALDDQYYSDQYGWALDGIVDPGFGNSIWIEMTSLTAGLETYEGGRRMMIGSQSFDPIFGTASSEMNWQWTGMMTHNWYAAADLGDYETTYRIYIGDSSGDAVAGFGETAVTLNLRAVPTPGSLSILGIGSLIATRRRRA